eukprot:CFRG3824T1
MDMHTLCRQLYADENTEVLSIAKEHMRLVKAKGGTGRSQEGKCLAVVCLFIACTQLNTEFPQERAMKVSSCSQKEFLSVLRGAKNLLGLQCGHTMGSLMVQQGTPAAVEKLGNKIMQDAGYDANSGRHTCVAFYLSCKYHKIRASKQQAIKWAEISAKEFDQICLHMRGSCSELTDMQKKYKKGGLKCKDSPTQSPTSSASSSPAERLYSSKTNETTAPNTPEKDIVTPKRGRGRPPTKRANSLVSAAQEPYSSNPTTSSSCATPMSSVRTKRNMRTPDARKGFTPATPSRLSGGARKKQSSDTTFSLATIAEGGMDTNENHTAKKQKFSDEERRRETLEDFTTRIIAEAQRKLSLKECNTEPYYRAEAGVAA